MRTIIVAAAILSVAGAANAADATKKVKHEPVAKGAKVIPLEKFMCRTGPNDEQVRLIVEAVKGRAMEFAFYSRLGTRVCSIHSRRGDGVTHWEDSEGGGGTARIKLQTGHALLEYQPGHHVKVTFSDVERMPYCGMYGELNGLIEAVQKKAECGMQGLFDGANEQDPKKKTTAAD